jgi:hypothetical protein
VDHVGHPAEFADGLDDAAGVELAALDVVGKFLTVGVGVEEAAREVVVVVNEVDLHTCCLNGSHLDDERMVRVIDDQIHARETDDLMQLVATFVDHTESGHEGTNLVTGFLYALGKLASDLSRAASVGHVGDNLSVDEKYLGGFHR